jgi:hypothetical protein
VRGYDAPGGSRDTIAVVAAHDELAHGTAGGFLHGDAFRLSALAQRRLFVVRQTECHGHDPNGISLTP